ncbi:MAG: preprotein translocase, partial [Burkholderiaceae bacterium]
MAKVKFTAGRVDGFKCESGKSQSFLWDTEAPGLGLRATANGAKAY